MKNKIENSVVLTTFLVLSYVLLDFLEIRDSLIVYTVDILIIYIIFYLYIDRNINYINNLLVASCLSSFFYFLFKFVEMKNNSLYVMKALYSDVQVELKDYDIEQRQMITNSLQNFINEQTWPFLTGCGVLINCLTVISSIMLFDFIKKSAKK